jgi:hypothetical protein
MTQEFMIDGRGYYIGRTSLQNMSGIFGLGRY